MLTLNEIEKQYTDNLKPFKRNILREYLQYKILEAVFTSEFAGKLSFLGGTSLRIIFNNTRFSEDLDFDNFGLTDKEFVILADKIKNWLEKDGFEVEIRNVLKGAFRSYIKIPKLLADNNLAVMPNEKIMIQVDTASHNFSYIPDKKILNKFDVFTQISVTPADILLSQKIYAILNRNRAKGRDFFDVIFLLGFCKPNFEYLKMKIGVDNGQDLKKKLLKELAATDLESLAKDVEPFLFNPSDSKKVILFRDYLQQQSFV